MENGKRAAEGQQGGRQRTVAIVGSSGTMGSGLAARLLHDPQVSRVIGIDLRAPSTLHPHLRFHRVDLSRPSADQELADILLVEEVDTLVHLAFLGAPIPNADYAHELEVIGTLHVLTAAAASKVERLVARSATIIYGAHPKNPNLLREENRLRGAPSSRFVSDKAEAERQIREFAASHPDVAVSILRFAPILGPGVANLFQRYLSYGAAPVLAGFDPLIQALYIDDAVDALFLATKRGIPGIFNVAGRGVLPISAALRRCGSRTIPLPYRMAEVALQGLRRVGFESVLPAAMLDYLRYPFVADPSRFEATFGFQPRYTTLDAIEAIGERHAEFEEAR